MLYSYDKAGFIVVVMKKIMAETTLSDALRSIRLIEFRFQSTNLRSIKNEKHILYVFGNGG